MSRGDERYLYFDIPFNRVSQKKGSNNLILHAHNYYNILIHDDPLLKRFIHNIRNAGKYEEADKKEDDDVDIDATDDNQ